MAQLNLFDVTPTGLVPAAQAPREESDQTIQERFDRWIADHPDVWALYREFATRLRDQGKRRYGSKAIVEDIRYHCRTTAHDRPGKKEFIINNDFTSRLARKLIAEDASFLEFFELRSLKAD